jgi:outer membrane protein OmpA-like peptidoglycan-associated protein
MRNLLFVFSLLFLLSVSAGNSFAQSTTRPWLVGVGVNAVDFHAPNEFGDLFKTEYWNSVPAIAHLTVGRSLNSSLGLDLQLGGARVTVDSGGNEVGGKGFFNGNLNLRYKFDNGYIIKENSVVGPYVFVRAGGSSLSGDEFRPNAGGGLGFNFFFWRDLGLYAQSSYNWASDDNSYMEHTAGVVVRFGAKDTDKDGIADEDDACPTEAGPETTKGCPDRDNDGVADKLDACPDVAGLATLNGCPDADADGIADKDDQCPNEAGPKELMGCPDRDGDAVADKNDLCPDEKGLVNLKGCPDSDGDGIADRDDKCPSRAGVASLQGCPDRDGDGIADDDDRCPQDAGPVSNGGCPVPKAEEIQQLNVAAKSIKFVTGSDKIQAESNKTLDDIATLMLKYPNTRWSIEGHTDNVGSDAKNLDLSKRRAASVKNYFIGKGVAADRLDSEGFGESRPVADNKTAAGRAENRRTEIKLIEIGVKQQ